MKNITFITTGQPTTNPRLVKEVNTLIYLGYTVKVICCFYESWAQQFDKEIVKKHKDIYIYCGGDPINNKLLYYKTRLRQKASLLLSNYMKGFGIAEKAISRAHTEALAQAKKIKTDLYIAHNLGALPAAAMAAKYAKAKIGYDAEDMHSGQSVSADNQMYRLNKYIEEKYFTGVNYFTAASPLIGQNYRQIYPYLKPVTINNVFPKTKLIIRQNYTGKEPLKLFWFSQTVGANRGIETIIDALSRSKHCIELHLLGNCSVANKAYLTRYTQEKGVDENIIHFHFPIPAHEIFSFASQFDIGMCTELSSTLNRDICLTNKIFTYIQAGLAVIASDTQAQQLFLSQYPGIGKIFNQQQVHTLTQHIDSWADDPEGLYQTRLRNYQLGQSTLNWENESENFVQIVQQVLANE